MTSKKILCLLSQAQGHGGIPRFNRNLFTAIKGNYAQVECLSLNDTEEEEISGFNGSKVAFMISAIRRMLAKPDVVIIGHLHFAPIALVAWILGIKSVLILHGIEAWDPRKSSVLFLRYVDAFWSVSQFTAEKFIQVTNVPKVKLNRIFNSLAPDWKRDIGQIKHNPYFLTVTRLDADEGYKGVDKTIMAINDLREELLANHWQYKVVAAGTDLPRHKRLVTDLGLEEVVQFYTNLNDQELKNLYDHCAFFMLPSTGEGFGIVFLEAMASKKACIGALGCGAEEVITQGETGWLINPETSELRDSMHRLINDEEACKSMGMKGFDRLMNRFAFDKFESRIKELT